MKMTLLVSLFSLVSFNALADELQCPQGTVVVGGAKSTMEAAGCMRADSTADKRVFHGPYVAYWPNGVKQAEGQYAEGFRDGKWVFFDRAGLKTGETFFRGGQYEGRRVEFSPNGSLTLQENYLAGRRHGQQVYFDASGKQTVVEYHNGKLLSSNNKADTSAPASTKN